MNLSRSEFLVMAFLVLIGITTPRGLASADDNKQENPVANPQTPNTATIDEKPSQRVMNYKPIYFAYGNPSTKIQFSFRSELSDFIPLNFAFTQVIFWELREKSKPFLDATYNPEFFYRFQPPGVKWTALDFGLWEHTSNGKDAQQSRSYNQSYLRAVYAAEGNRWTTVLALKLKYVYNIENANSDISKYNGPIELDVRFVRLLDIFLDQSEIILSVRPGGKFATDFAKGGYQIAANFHVAQINMNPAFYLQYYQGFAETLLNYNEHIRVVRFGLMF